MTLSHPVSGPSNSPKTKRGQRKLDGQGNEKWTSRFASFGGYLSGAHSCILELDNGGYLVNYRREAFPGLDDIPPILIWLDSLGNVTQQYDFPNNFIYTIGDLIKTADGRIVGVGQVDLLDYDLGFGGWVFAFTQSGELLWQRYIVDQHFLPEKLGWFSGVVELDDGRLAMTGTIDTPADVDIWLVVLDSEGCLEPGCMGEFQGYVSGIDSPVDNDTPISIFPNPTSGSFITLKGADFMNGNAEQFTINIYDVVGRLVRSQPAREQIDVAGLSCGNYFLGIQAGNGINRLVGRFVKL
ncbi:MAG: T9SS type A sorting domain-containing protein [Bacteroidetes bacterium]|nr:T9SS type A sorting domain-containing protein [Bacteroidota bacterium]